MNKYKTVGNGRSSNVDESLFGMTRGNQIMQSKRAIKPSMLPPSAVIVTSAELERLKRNASIKSDAEINNERDLSIQLREEREMKAKLRKERMRQLGQIAAIKAVKSDSEIEDEAKKEVIRSLAADKLDKNHDVVKMLESMSARAVAFTLRDQQLGEKERAQNVEAEYNRRMDIIMEIDRLKELKKRDDEEQLKKMKRVEDREVIAQQIAYRQHMKIIDAEARERDNIAMREMMKKYEEDDMKIRVLHQQEVIRSREEFIVANNEAIQRKAQHKEQEKQDVADILVYQASKDMEMRKREEVEMMNEKLKRERQAQLLSQQERIQSNAGKLDEIRARRAEEERERRYRQHEHDQMMKKKQDMKILIDARVQQAQDKTIRAEKDAIMSQQQYQHDMEYNMRMQQREEDEMRMKREQAIHHRNQVMMTIEERKKAREMSRANVDDEGTRYRQERVSEVSKLASIRDKMVDDLASKGVNKKYLTEMKAVDIARMVNR